MTKARSGGARWRRETASAELRSRMTCRRAQRRKPARNAGTTPAPPRSALPPDATASRGTEEEALADVDVGCTGVAVAVFAFVAIS